MFSFSSWRSLCSPIIFAVTLEIVCLFCEDLVYEGWRKPLDVPIEVFAPLTECFPVFLPWVVFVAWPFRFLCVWALLFSWWRTLWKLVANSPLLLTFELITLSLAWEAWCLFAYLSIIWDDWWELLLFYAAFNSFSLLSNWTFLSYYSILRCAFWAMPPLYLEVAVALELLPVPVFPLRSLLNTLFCPIELLLPWDDFLTGSWLFNVADEAMAFEVWLSFDKYLCEAWLDWFWLLIWFWLTPFKLNFLSMILGFYNILCGFVVAEGVLTELLFTIDWCVSSWLLEWFSVTLTTAGWWEAYDPVASWSFLPSCWFILPVALFIMLACGILLFELWYESLF